MYNIQNIFQLLSIVGGSVYSAESLIKYLKEIGITDNDVKKLNKYSVKLIWILALEKYSKKFTLPDIVVKTLQLSLIEIKDPQMQYDMQDFLNFPSYTKCENLYKKIYNSIPKDVIKDTSEILSKIQSQVPSTQNQTNISFL